MTVIAEVRAIDSKYMNATTRFGLAFRGGIALIDNERILGEALQLKGIQIIPSDAVLERLPAILDALGPFKPPQADIHLPDGYKLRQKAVGGYWQMLYKNRTLEQRFPIPDPEPEPVPGLVLAGWEPTIDVDED